MQSDHPSWALDGVSLVPFIEAAAAEIPRARPKPIGFWWGNAQVWMDNDMKLTNAQSPGQGCVAEAPWLTPSESGMRLFNLSADHTESVDLAVSHSATYASMSKDLAAWLVSVQHSMAVESHCSGADPEPGPPPAPPAPLPPSAGNCTFLRNIGGFGGDRAKQHVETKEDCCAICMKDASCTVAVFAAPNVCHIKEDTKAGYAKPGYWACRARPK